VGVFMGRPITCADCQVMGTWQTNTLVGVHKQVGAGRVFAWADEWVTYTSQWKGDSIYQAKPVRELPPRTKSTTSRSFGTTCSLGGGRRLELFPDG